MKDMESKDKIKRKALEKLEKQVKENIRYWMDSGKQITEQLLCGDLKIDQAVFSREELSEISTILSGIKNSLCRFEFFCHNRDIQIPCMTEEAGSDIKSLD